MYTYIQRTEERYADQGMKQELSLPIKISNWKKDKFLMSYHDEFEGWEITHSGEDEVTLHIYSTLELNEFAICN